jgi:outer membrane immunogenic protein
MRKILVSLAASLAIASPALANEARVEARGGVVFGSGDEEAIAGIAAGYDYDLGSKAFVGAEVSADKVLEGGTRVTFGLGGRAGVKLAEAGKLYVAGSWQSKPCSFCDDFWSAGAGYQHNFGTNLYGKVEYRHFIVDNANDPDAVLVGLGARF